MSFGEKEGSNNPVFRKMADPRGFEPLTFASVGNGPDIDLTNRNNSDKPESPGTKTAQIVRELSEIFSMILRGTGSPCYTGATRPDTSDPLAKIPTKGRRRKMPPP
jgi:hypothetical protein